MALFDFSHVIDGLEAADQDAVFEALAQKAVELGVTSDASAVVADLRAREGEASTGFGDGIAIPHAKSPNVTAPSIVFARLGAGVEWNALDGEPVDTVINILVPEGGSNTHLQLLAKLARNLVHKDFVAKLKQDSTEDVCALIQGVVG